MCAEKGAVESSPLISCFFVKGGFTSGFFLGSTPFGSKAEGGGEEGDRDAEVEGVTAVGHVVYVLLGFPDYLHYLLRYGLLSCRQFEEAFGDVGFVDEDDCFSLGFL